ncbi:MAG TPA: type VI secretion system contractile sheath large subunit, partial [Reyranella sp.]|nr:type VI secretion system contractile sheath large subunit [Reyranella sp.]
MGNEVTIAGASATAVEQSATAAEPGGSLRESVLAGRFFGERHAGPAAELAAFLHGGLDAASALQAWFGEALSGLLAAGALRAALDRDIAEIDAAMSEQLDAVLHAPRFLNLEGRWRGL